MQSVSAADSRLQSVPSRSQYAALTAPTTVTADVVPAVQVAALPSTALPATAPTSTAALGGGKRTVVLAVCCSALFMVGLDNTIVNVGLPDIGESLHTAVSGLQWTVAGYTIVLRPLSETYGPVPATAVSTVAGAVPYLAFAGSVWPPLLPRPEIRP